MIQIHDAVRASASQSVSPRSAIAVSSRRSGPRRDDGRSARSTIFGGRRLPQHALVVATGGDNKEGSS